MNTSARLQTIEGLVRKHFDPQPGVVIAFLAGSLVEGYGNPTSDIDVLVLSEGGGGFAAQIGGDRRVFTARECELEIVHLNGERLDIETRSLARVQDTIDYVRSLPLTQEGSYEVSISTVQFLHQVRVGRPVKGAVGLDALRNSVDWPHLAEILRIRHETEYSGHAEDAAGAIHIGDAGTALLASRRALGSAMDCLIAALGHTNPKEKWRYRKLLELGQADLIQRCLALECDLNSTPEMLLRSARRRLVAAQDLVAQAGR